MMREAQPDDAEDIERYLAQFPGTTMFLRSNLAAQGMGWTDHRHSTRFYLWERDDTITAVFGVTKDGYLMAEASDAPLTAFRDFASQLPYVPIKGMTGDQVSVEGTLSALGFAKGDFKLLRDEPLLILDLDALPPAELRLRTPCEKDRDLLACWFYQYELDTALSSSQQQAKQASESRLHDAIAPGTPIRLAHDDQGQPCAMASLNASVADVVQVGGVFVPREKRSQGLGRKVTSARLYEARRTGARKAILFAANPAAERAYQAIGFRNIGTYRLALFSEPQTAKEPKL